jgi:protein SCO1
MRSTSGTAAWSSTTVSRSAAFTGTGPEKSTSKFTTGFTTDFRGTMSNHFSQPTHQFQATWFASVCILVGILLLSAGCASKPDESARRFHLHGKIVSVDVKDGSAEVDHDAIPGFMDAMTMSYPVPDAKTLATLGRGDEIMADVVVIDNVAHLENVVIVKRASKPDPAATSEFRMPAPGDTVPDFALLDQNGRRIHLRSYRGDALLLTFIYTRCPFADFCPKVSDDFAHIYAALRKGPASDSKIRLLSVSFDPTHDTPAVLRQYAASFRDTTGTDRPFDHWEFAAAPKNELPKMAKFFGLYYNAQNGQIIHSVSTSLISPDGKIVAWFHDNDWKPQVLLTEAGQTLTGPQQRNAHAKKHGTFKKTSEN